MNFFFFFLETPNFNFNLKIVLNFKDPLKLFSEIAKHLALSFKRALIP